MRGWVFVGLGVGLGLVGPGLVVVGLEIGIVGSEGRCRRSLGLAGRRRWSVTLCGCE
jgi:hypothetical protein